MRGATGDDGDCLDLGAGVCACGCGRLAAPGRRFAWGHNSATSRRYWRSTSSSRVTCSNVSTASASSASPRRVKANATTAGAHRDAPSLCGQTVSLPALCVEPSKCDEENRVSERLLRACEIADLLGISASTVLDWFEAGRLPGFRLSSRAVRFRESELMEWLEERHVAARSASCPAPDRVA